MVQAVEKLKQAWRPCVIYWKNGSAGWVLCAMGHHVSVSAHSAGALQCIRMPVVRLEVAVALAPAAVGAGSQDRWNPATCLPAGQLYSTTVAPLPPTPNIESRYPIGLPYLRGIVVKPLGKLCFESGSPWPSSSCRGGHVAPDRAGSVSIDCTRALEGIASNKPCLLAGAAARAPSHLPPLRAHLQLGCCVACAAAKSSQPADGRGVARGRLQALLKPHRHALHQTTKKGAAHECK